ncbi:hypothetical protein SHIRM173S_00438 [Streptomyces hirsutus]
MVSYTLTIEQTGGSGITVPGRGFLLNNESTGLLLRPGEPGRARPEPAGSRQAAPVLDGPDDRADRHDRPVVALGSPGGSTIITTVLQTLTGFLDRGLPLADAIAAPRASQRNTARTDLEPGLYDSAVRRKLEAIGHSFQANPEIGATTAVQRLPDGRWVAAAEKTRRGGGSAMVVRPGKEAAGPPGGKPPAPLEGNGRPYAHRPGGLGRRRLLATGGGVGAGDVGADRRTAAGSGPGRRAGPGPCAGVVPLPLRRPPPRSGT